LHYGSNKTLGLMRSCGFASPAALTQGAATYSTKTFTRSRGNSSMRWTIFP
jgi:hypothetical protein